MTSCRICYDEKNTNPLLNPCDCKGSAAGIHKKCLEKWMRISSKSNCEICLAPYTTANDEVIYRPRYMFLTNSVLCFYTTVFGFGWLIYRDSMRFGLLQEIQRVRSLVTEAIPFLLLLNVGLLLTVLIPAIRVIRDKKHYLQNAFSLMRYFYFLAMLGSILATFAGYPIVGSFVATNMLGKLYTIHCSIVVAMNKTA